jgi:3-oxoacyl-[acyl-carrier-protein] synthase II
MDAKAGNSNYTSGETSGQVAVLQAARRLRRGRMDAAVAGGFSGHHEDVILGMLAHNGFLKQPSGSTRHAIDPAKSDGTVVAEGGVFMLLETEEQLAARGGRAIAEVVGGATSTTASGPFLKDFSPVPARLALTSALNNAGIKAEDVGLVWLAQSGIAALDTAERDLAATTFGPHTAAATTARVWGNLMEAGGLGEAALIDALYDTGSVPDLLTVPKAVTTVDRTKPYVVISRPSLFGDWSFLILKRG